MNNSSLHSLAIFNFKSMRYLKNILVMISFISGSFIWAQTDTTDQLQTQRLIIIKPYSPTVSDAVKIKQKPPAEKEDSLFRKKEIQYDIHSVPVASTFIPEKGSASGVERVRQAKLYDSYAALGIGNYTNLLAEFYTDLKVGDRQRFTIDLQHHSSQGGIKKLDLKGYDKYTDTDFGLGFKSEEDKFFWDGRINLLHQQYNWYGIFDNVFSESQLNEINPRHNYLGVGLNGNIEMKESFFNKASLDFQHFGDDYNSSENRIVLKPEFKFDIHDENISTQVTVDFLSGKFKDHLNTGQTKFGILNMGVFPAYNYNYGELAFTVGAEVFYSSDIENSKQKFFIHPKVKVSYHLAEEFLTAYAGLDGSLKQNSYFGFAQENPFVAPQLWIAPTHTPFDLFVGAKGFLMDELFYDLRVGYQSEKDKALYHANSSTFPTMNNDFSYNNSFLVEYQDVKSFYLRAGLEYKLRDDLNMGLNIAYTNYSVNDREDDPRSLRAWNLPNMKAAFTTDYKLTDQWNFGAELFYIGERKDYLLDFNEQKIVKAKAFLDANLKVNFQMNDQIGFFLRGNNLFNDNYNRWYNYPVQGLQVMAGMSYQF